MAETKEVVDIEIEGIGICSNSIVDEEFFEGTSLKSNFLCNIGYTDENALFPKLPRFPFDKVCSYV